MRGAPHWTTWCVFHLRHSKLFIRACRSGTLTVSQNSEQVALELPLISFAQEVRFGLPSRAHKARRPVQTTCGFPPPTQFHRHADGPGTGPTQYAGRRPYRPRAALPAGRLSVPAPIAQCSFSCPGR